MFRILSKFIFVILNLCFLLECKTSTESISITNRDIIYDKYYTILTDSSNFDAQPLGIINVSSGGLFVCGRLSKSSISQESFILRIDDSGNEIWQSTFKNLRLSSALEVPDGGFVVTGGNLGRIDILKCDINGNIEWEKSINLMYGSSDHKIILTKSNDLIVISNTCAIGVAFILKMDLFGNIIWKKFPTPDGIGGHYHAIIENSDSNLVVVGSTKKIINGDDFDIECTFWIELLDQNGEYIEHKIYNEDLYPIQSNSMIAVSENNFIVNGYSYIAYLDGIGNVIKYYFPFPDHRYNAFSAYDFDINETGNLFVIGGLYKDESYNEYIDLAYFKLSSTCGQMFLSVENNSRYIESALYLVNYNDDESIITSGYRKFSENQGSKVWISKFNTD